MKLKNVVVGSEVEAKHDTKYDTKFFKRGDLVKVMAKEDDNYDGEMSLNIMDSDGYPFWVNHKDFRRPRPKKIDQSIFDGVDSRYSYFAIDEDGRGGFYDQKPELCGDYFTSGDGWQPVGQYDASDWKNSLIEREKKELTGSELCKAMIIGDRDWVLAYVSNENDATALFHKNAMVVTDFDLSEDAFYCRGENFAYAVPINNQGEPLTAKDVGL